MSLLQLGFREIGRKFQRLRLGRRIKAAGKERTDALRALGRRAAEAGVTGVASEGLKAGLAETEAKDRQLASRLNALDEQKKALEAQRDADSARFDALEKEVMARKSPVDAELAAQQKTATRHQRDSEDVRRRLNQAN
jgi:predicted  nucleic acid-binding Zn-ribbon protein